MRKASDSPRIVLLLSAVIKHRICVPQSRSNDFSPIFRQAHLRIFDDLTDDLTVQSAKLVGALELGFQLCHAIPEFISRCENTRGIRISRSANADAF
jgi:hypothetical protein